MSGTLGDSKLLVVSQSLVVSKLHLFYTHKVDASTFRRAPMLTDNDLSQAGGGVIATGRLAASKCSAFFCSVLGLLLPMGLHGSTIIFFLRLHLPAILNQPSHDGSIIWRL